MSVTKRKDYDTINWEDAERDIMKLFHDELNDYFVKSKDKNALKFWKVLLNKYDFPCYYGFKLKKVER